MTAKSVKSIIDRPRIDRLPEWKALAKHRKRMGRTSLTELFAADRRRGTRCSTEALGIHFDWSKHLVDAETMKLLFALARAAGVEKHRDAMFKGGKINITEDRAVLHTALRAPADAVIEVDGENVVPAVHEVLRRMGAFADKIRRGRWLGHSGRPIRNVVNIGIGGSDLGPAMAYDALRKYSDRGLTVRFVSNVDANDFHEKTLDLDPEETLFIVCSKTFTTLETMTNARTARKWVLKAFDGEQAASAKHFVAVSTNAEEVAKFGIDTRNMFGFWDWVGGRYSMDSAVGLSTMVAIGPKRFRELLDGFHDMDEHFRRTPMTRNLPMIQALIGLWYADFWDAGTVAILPYDQYLDRFSAYLQQLEMESNGKHTQLDGKRVAWGTCPAIWGQPGTNGQHAFYQLLHQGTDVIPCEFIVAARGHEPDLAHHHALLVANCLAQSEALMNGRTREEAEALLASEGKSATEIARLAPHKVFPGNRPSLTIVHDQLTPRALGRLLALYEHRVFVEGAIWNINSFDQWGVELGKVLANELLPMLDGREAAGDPAEMVKLRQDLEDEKLANAQLEERVRTLRERLEARDAELEAARGAQADSLRRLDADLQSLRKANQQLRDNNQALREAHQAGVAEPHLINKSMLAELEGLRAARAADRDEVEAVLTELGQVIAEAGGDTETKTEDA